MCLTGSQTFRLLKLKSNCFLQKGNIQWDIVSYTKIVGKPSQNYPNAYFKIGLPALSLFDNSHLVTVALLKHPRSVFLPYREEVERWS